MIDVSNETKEAFLSDSSHKAIRVYFPELNMSIGNDSIVKETLKLSESILSGNSLEFVGCNSSCLQITLYNVSQNIKDKKIEVYITADNTDEIPLFKGIIDSVVIEANKQFKKITAYDALYSKASDVDIAEWYKALTFPMTLLQFRNNLFDHLGINQNAVILPNDNISIRQQYMPSQMNALDTIKNICQFNGVFGIINRYGKFDYISLSTQSNGTFPATYTFPSLSLFPSDAESANTTDNTMIPLYQSMEYEDYDVFAITKVLIRDSEDDQGISYEAGDNVYIVQGNIFAFNLSDDVKLQVAKNIYDNVSQFNYRPFRSNTIGLPFIEVGSIVTFYVNNYNGTRSSTSTRSFYVMNRSMKGIQSLFDGYSAEGEKYQKIFLSDIGSKLDSLQTRVDASCTIGEVMEMIEDMSTPTGFTVVSCNTLPTSRGASTIYLVRGDITIL